MNDLGHAISAFVKTFFWGLIICLIMALPVMWLWNWLMPSIFGLREILWSEALGLDLLFYFLVRR